MRVPRWAILGAIVAAFAGCAGPAGDATAGAPSRPAAGSAPSLLSQVYLPKGTSSVGRPVPLVVLVPGGGWTSADPSGLEPLGAALAAGGDAAVTTTYRTSSDGVTFPVPLEDVVCAVDGAVAKVREGRAQVGPVVVVGHSAGAQLAALAALVGDRHHVGCSSPPARIDGLVGLAGPYDIVVAADAAQPLFDATPSEDPDSWRAANPMEQAGQRPGLPVLLVNGEADELVPPWFAQRFAAALEAGGHRVSVTLLPGVDHQEIYTVEHALGPIRDFVETIPRRPAPPDGR